MRSLDDRVEYTSVSHDATAESFNRVDRRMYANLLELMFLMQPIIGHIEVIECSSS